jgi:two-component system, OmpR family, response regulator
MTVQPTWNSLRIVSDLAVRWSSLQGLPVELLDWPAEAARRQVLARAGVPRVLLIAPDAMPPQSLGVDEDWVRLPAAESDVVARATQLLCNEGIRSDTPYVDVHRVLHRAGATVTLPSSEATIMSLLLRNAGVIVSRSDLEHAVWKDAAPSRDAIDAVIYRLRRRLAGLSLCIRSARGQGFVLYLDAP